MKPKADPLNPHESILMTGATGFIGKRLLKTLLARPGEIWLLTRPESMPDAQAFLQQQGETPGIAHLVAGDVMRQDLFCNAEDAARLGRTVRKVVHLAAVYQITMPRALGMAVNVGGTENVLRFCENSERLERLLYASTVAISGRHPGTFREEDFDRGQGFRNAYDETKFLAEKLVRDRRDKIPTVICRPTVVVGDSRTGEAERVDGPYYLFRAISRRLHLIMVNSGVTKCHAVPVDFVADVMAHLLESPKAAGQTFHIGDPHPMTYEEFVNLACELWPAPKPLMTIPPWLMDLQFRLPGFSAFTGVPRESLAYSVIPVEYTFDHMTEILRGSGLVCPDIREILPVLIRGFKERLR